MSKANLGIDISKTKFDAALLLGDRKIKNKQFENNTEGFIKLSEWLNKLEVEDLHVCMEATGIYGEALANYLFEKGHRVSVVNALQIKGFAQSQLSRTKTDKADAQLIACFCKAIQPKAWKPEPKHIRDLQAWVNRWEALKTMYQQEKNRLGVAPEATRHSIAEMCETIGKQIEAARQKIKEHIHQHPDLQRKQTLLDSIPGIGEATIAQVIAFIGNPKAFRNAKQLAAFVGLNPKHCLSGSSVRGRTRLSKMGDCNLRKTFYMPAVVARRYNPIIATFCQRLKQAGKSNMVIIGATMRKLLHIIYGVLKSGKPFDMHFLLQNP